MGISSEARRGLILGLLRESTALATFSKEVLELATLVYGDERRASDIARERNVIDGTFTEWKVTRLSCLN